MLSSITENLAEAKQRVSDALARAGRPEGDCELLVVSKTWASEIVAEVVGAGQCSFGENKVQEAEVKIPKLSDGLHWHLIGHLQRNKVRKALSLFSTLHGLDSLKLARYTSNIATEIGCCPDVFLQIDLAGEDTKNGYDQETLYRDLDELLDLKGINITGLMCIPPFSVRGEDSRPWFVKLRELRDALEMRAGCKLTQLSMGMSGDFEVAIEEGSTIVRVGSAIFGNRNYPPKKN